MQRPTRTHGQLRRRRKPVQSLSGLQLRRLLLLCPLSSQHTLYTSHCQLFRHSLCVSFLFRIFRGLSTCHGVFSVSEPSISHHRLEQITNAHLFQRTGLFTAVSPILKSVVLCGSSSLSAGVAGHGQLREAVETAGAVLDALVGSRMHSTQAAHCHWQCSGCEECARVVPVVAIDARWCMSSSHRRWPLAEDSLPDHERSSSCLLCAQWDQETRLRCIREFSSYLQLLSSSEVAVAVVGMAGYVLAWPVSPFMLGLGRCCRTWSTHTQCRRMLLVPIGASTA